MPNLNRVMLMGNLTRDPELRYTPANTAVANLGLAVNRRWKNQNGEQQEETTFIDCEAWGRTAEVLNQYLQKGRPVYVEGRLKLDQWQDKDGQNRSKLKVVVEQFQFIDSKPGAPGSSGNGGDSSGGGYNNRAPQQRRGAPAQPNAGNSGNSGGGGEYHEPIDEGDIPF